LCRVCVGFAKGLGFILSNAPFSKAPVSNAPVSKALVSNAPVNQHSQRRESALFLCVVVSVVFVMFSRRFFLAFSSFSPRFFVDFPSFSRRFPIVFVMFLFTKGT
jgi:predicted benzoate:H+ symporter BenE